MKMSDRSGQEGLGDLRPDERETLCQAQTQSWRNSHTNQRKTEKFGAARHINHGAY